MKPFALSEMETHLITRHRVSTESLARHRVLARDKGFSYEEFLETNHKLMHTMRRGMPDHDEETES